MHSTGLEIMRLRQDLVPALTEFFDAFRNSQGAHHFRPHPLTSEEAHHIASLDGKDLYYVLSDGNRVLGYGMLRGWDEGFEIPSLGIAIHPDERGQGFGSLLMHFLHQAAKARGASQIRLSVHADNSRAIDMYRELGYSFEPADEGRLVGTRSLL